MKPIETDNVKVTSAFTGKYKTRTYKVNGKQITDHHYGVDLVGGTKILATANGKVIQVVNKGSKGGTMCLIRIQHKTYQSAYYHIKSGSALVKVGDYVKKGQHIATIGNTGNVSGTHLHFQIDKGKNSNAIDPILYAKGNKELEGIVIPSSDWEEGVYKTIKEKYLRKTPEVKTNNKVKYSVLSDKSKAKCYQDKLGYAKYKLNKEIELHEFATDKKGNIWGRTNTLWVCVQDSSGKQVVKV